MIRLLLAAIPWSFAAAAPEFPALSTAAFVSPSTAAYSSFSGVVGDIRIHRLNVFDPSVPGEDWWGFQTANKIHIPTKEYVLKREILMDSGDRWDPLKAIESERNLRALGYIRSAELVPSQGANGSVDLDLYSQDSWTLSPELNFGTEGGQSYFDYGVAEGNLFGYGKEISILHGNIGSDVGTDHRTELRYHDPRVWGSRVDATGIYTTTHYGDQLGALFEKPFFALDTPYEWRVLWANIYQQDVLYQDAAETTDFIQNFRSVSSEAGMKVGPGEDLVHRIYAGTYYEKDNFLASPTTISGTIPNTLTMSGPYIGYQLLEPEYIKETYINSMQRVEDFDLGNEFYVRAGSMLQSWGSDSDRWILNAVDQQGLGFGEGKFMLGQVGVQGRMHDNRLENSIFYGNLNLFYKSVWPWTQTWVAHAEANVTRNLDPWNQLILGGNTGLRGYKSDSFTGTRSVLLNLEDRLFLVHQFFHLFYTGGVAFFDMGAVSPDSKGFQWSWVKSDVGIGLRFSPTRSTSGSVVRMDIAYALNSGPGPSRWVVGIRGGQAFNVFNSTNQEVLQTPAAAITSDSPGSTLRRQ